MVVDPAIGRTQEADREVLHRNEAAVKMEMEEVRAVPVYLAHENVELMLPDSTERMAMNKRSARNASQSHFGLTHVAKRGTTTSPSSADILSREVKVAPAMPCGEYNIFLRSLNRLGGSIQCNYQPNIQLVQQHRVVHLQGWQS